MLKRVSLFSIFFLWTVTSGCVAAPALFAAGAGATSLSLGTLWAYNQPQYDNSPQQEPRTRTRVTKPGKTKVTGGGNTPPLTTATLVVPTDVPLTKGSEREKE